MLTSGATIGIIGGGQLGQMLADAARELGYKTHIFVPEEESPASQRADVTTVAAYDDTQALLQFAQAVDVVTFEFENIPPHSLSFLAKHVAVYPDPDVLEVCRNRNREKQFLNNHGIATAPFFPVHSVGDLADAMTVIGTPSVVKTAEMGYDGKGQVKLVGGEDVLDVWNSLNCTEAVLEGWVPFDYEISVIVARDQNGSVRCYDAVKNIHRDHILHKTIAPHDDGAVALKAKEIAQHVGEAIGLIGILAVEMFVCKDGQILVNEMAPRPHNSGHWSIEGAVTSQFAQLIRIVCGLGVGDSSTKIPCEMINLIGDEIYALDAYQQNPQAHIHDYGKKQARAGRKMGHVTIVKG